MLTSTGFFIAFQPKIMRRSLILVLIIVILLPAISHAQKTDPNPSEAMKETKRMKEEEAMRKAMAEAEAMRKKMEAEEAARKKAYEEYQKKLAEMKAESKPAGFQLLKIPVAGGYYLGMQQREYDSLANLNPPSVTTELKRYDLRQAPNFYMGRLFMLSFSLPDSIFSSDMPDLTSYYNNKLGTPDEEKISDTVMVFPSVEDSSLTGEFRVKQAVLTWHYKDHDIDIRYRFTDMKNGAWRGFYRIRYNGTVDYVKNLGRLAEKEN
jgi:hypothetical protein